MRILVSGASGLIGSALVAALESRGDHVCALVRGTATREGDVSWDPAAGTIDHAALADGSFDAVLHFAGEPLLGRWTDEKREQILRSRVDGTTLLAEALAALEDRPDALLMASAVGIYGDRDEELLTEDSRAGDGFLAGVVLQWENAAEPAREAGIRVAQLRMAPVQTPLGGGLKQQLLPFKLGVGGRVGSGQQWTPWIGLHETVRAWLFAIDDERVEGPINVVGPTPARNIEFTKALGSVLNRPTILPVPVPMVKLMYGSQLVDEMLLGSQKVVPARLEGLGFEFEDRTIRQALRRELGR